MLEEQIKLKQLIRENIESARELRICWEKYDNEGWPEALRHRKRMQVLWCLFMDRAAKIRRELYGIFVLEELFV